MTETEHDYINNWFYTKNVPFLAKSFKAQHILKVKGEYCFVLNESLWLWLYREKNQMLFSVFPKRLGTLNQSKIMNDLIYKDTN